MIENNECKNVTNLIIFYNKLSSSYNLISDCFMNNKLNILFNISFYKGKKTSNYFNINYTKNINEEIMQKSDLISDIMEEKKMIDINTYTTIGNKKSDIISDIMEEKKVADINTYITIENKKIDLNLNITKNELANKIPEILEFIEIGENYELKGKDFTIIIKPTNSAYMNNSTHLNFQKCEKILRNNSNIDISRILTLFQVEIKNINEQSLVNQVEYQIYDDNKTLLDLSQCQNTDIEVYYKFKNDSYDLLSYNYFKSSNINIFNINDSFFNDICMPFCDDNENDVVLEDRIKDIYQNYSLCEKQCILKEVNFENKSILCDCSTKGNLSVEEPALNIIYFDEIEIESNFGLIKCYKLVFSFKGKFKNIGFWIFSNLIILQIPFIFIYFY